MLKELLFSDTGATQLGLTILRVGVGLMFTLHGWPKVLHGVETWRWMGSQLEIIGIKFMPVVWGLIATMTEFGGGIFLMLGIASRPIAILQCCVLIVALMYHFHRNDPFDVYSNALTLLIALIAIIIAGPGSFSVDHCLVK